MSDLKRTPLFDEHQKLNARLVPFAGWEMPVQYVGVLQEARACRESCGIFDVSHMGQLIVNETDDTKILNRIVSADWENLESNRAGYALLLNKHGGVIDDVMGFRLEEADDNWMIIVNASRAFEDEAQIKACFQESIESSEGVSNCYNNQAMIAVQGPNAEVILQPLCDEINLSTMRWRDVSATRIASAFGVLSRGGYTGLDGFEFMFNAEDASKVWRALLEAGATPCGLGARDALRLEAGLPLYGHELRDDLTPYESGCGWAVNMDKPDFVGKSALQNQQNPQRRIRALQMESRAIPREGYAVFFKGERVGEVTSGTMSPALNIGIALALVPSTIEVGDAVAVEVRGVQHAARIVKPPFVPHGARK